MLLPPFDYLQPANKAEAIAMLAEYKDRAKILAGGTDLLVNLKMGKLAPGFVVSLSGLAELCQGDAADGKVSLGSRLTAARLAANGFGAPTCLKLAAAQLGSPQVRNLATIGGNLATARPAGDMCTALLAAGAEVVLESSTGSRSVGVGNFFTGPGQTVIQSDEILTGVIAPAKSPGAGSGYYKLGLRAAVEIALVSAAVFLSLEADGNTIKEARIALGAVGPTPLLCPGAAASLAGSNGDEKALAMAAEKAAGEARPIDDHRGSAEYRREMVKVLVRRALADALAEARG